MAHTEARIDFGEEQLEDESMGGSMSFLFELMLAKQSNTKQPDVLFDVQSCKESRD